MKTRTFLRGQILAMSTVAALSTSGARSGAQAATSSPAFPTAIGFGAAATGGRGGSVYVVTNLNDSGTGSLRDAVSQSNRIVVFAVGGYINLQSELSVASNITVEGQTAPGGGIGVMGAPVSFTKSSNDIVRFMRFRQGSNPAFAAKSALEMDNTYNTVLDHVSVSFSPYDNIDINALSGTANSNFNVTFQNSILGDPIAKQQFNVHQTASNITYANDIFANAHNRSPLAKGNTQFTNNVVYDYQAGYTVADTAGKFKQDILNNYFIAGPSTTSAGDAFFQMDNNITAFASGNLLDASKNGALGGTSVYPNGVTPANSSWNPSTLQSPLRSATGAYSYDVANAGDTAHRDAVDQKIINNVTSLGAQGRILNSTADTGLSNNGFGVIPGGALPLGGTSGDVPIAWIQQHGLTAADFANPTGDYNGTGYNNIEKYANFIAGDPVQLGNEVYFTGVQGNNWGADNGGQTNFSTSATTNANYGSLPGILDDVHFNAASAVTGGVNLGGNRSVNSLTVDAGTTQPIVINSGSTLTVGAGGISVAGAGGLAINSALVDNGGGLNAADGNLTVGGPLALGDAADAFMAAAGQTLLLDGSLNRANATVDFSGGGTIKGSALANAGNTGIIGGWATYNQADWATVSNGAVAAYTGYVNAVTGTNVQALAGYTSNANVRIDGSSSGNVNLGGGVTTVNTLLDNDAASRLVDIGNGNTLRLGPTGGILLAPNSGPMTIGSPGNAGALTAGGSAGAPGELLLINNALAAPLTVNSNIVDNSGAAVTVTTSGAGVIQLNGDNVYTGGTNIDAGTLQIGSNAALPQSGAVFINPLATLDLHGNNATLGALNGSGNIDNENTVATGNYTITVGGNNQNSNFNGAIGDTYGVVAVVANGTGVTTLGGASTYSGGTTVNGGTLALANVSGAGIGAITLDGGSLTLVNGNNILANNLNVSAAGGTLNFGRTLAYVSSNVSGSGTLNIATSSAPAFSGSISAFVGTVTLGNNNATFRLFGGFVGSTAATFDLGSAAGTLDAGKIYYNDTINLGALEGGTNTSLDGSASTGVQVGFSIGANNASTTFGGVIHDGGGSPTFVTKVGAGMLTFSGANTYSGPTAINAGTLLVDNVTGSGVGAGPVTVASGATFGGVGAISGSLLNNGHLMPGNGASAGILTLATATLGDNSSLNYILNSANGAPGSGGNSLLKLVNLTVGNHITLDLSPGNAFGAGVYHLITYSGTLTNGADLANWAVSGPKGYLYSFNASPGSINLQVTSVPEPASLALLALGAGVISIRRRRTRR